MLHPPLRLASVTNIVDPGQTADGPPIADGSGLTVTTAVRLHPKTEVYVMVALTGATPETIPEALPTVATSVLLLLHVPPAVASVSETVEPAHTASGPEIRAGNGFTVIGRVEVQPAPRE